MQDRIQPMRSVRCHLKLALLWLTTVASGLGVLPQFNCVCPNGKLNRINLISYALSTGCSCPTPCCQTEHRIESISSQTHEKHSSLTHACCAHDAEAKSPPLSGGKKSPGKGCKKELVVIDSTTASSVDDVSRIELQVASLPAILHIPFGLRLAQCVDSRSLINSSAPCPPPDLVVVLRHLII